MRFIDIEATMVATINLLVEIRDHKSTHRQLKPKIACTILLLEDKLSKMRKTMKGMMFSEALEEELMRREPEDEWMHITHIKEVRPGAYVIDTTDVEGLAIYVRPEDPTGEPDYPTDPQERSERASALAATFWLGHAAKVRENDRFSDGGYPSL